MSKSLKSAGSATLAFCLTAGVVALLAEQPARASVIGSPASDKIEVSERVSTAGLDLARSDDVRLLESRIRSAARRVCSLPGDRQISAERQLCLDGARRSADQQVAALFDRERRLASAGRPAELRTTVTVIAPGNE